MRGVDGWFFSARLAWARPWMRWGSVFALSIALATSIWFLWQLVPSAQANKTFAFHYNIYLGIDDVRDWPWAFALPAIWIVLTGVDILAAYGIYRTDAIMASCLVGMALLWSFPWAVALFYLTVINFV